MSKDNIQEIDNKFYTAYGSDLYSGEGHIVRHDAVLELVGVIADSIENCLIDGDMESVFHHVTTLKSISNGEL